MSGVRRKPAFCICKTKGADQLRNNCTSDQHLCFRFIDSTNPLLPKSEISRLLPSSVVVRPGLCLTWSETLKTGFLMTRLIGYCVFQAEDVVNVAVDKINGLLESFMGINDTDLGEYMLRIFITKTRPCNILRYFTTVKIVNFR